MLRRGSDAARLSELAAFVAELESAPLARLAAELPGFLRLSDRKLDLVRQILRLRLRNVSGAERASFRSAALAAAGPTTTPDVAALLERLGA